jgi:hypothetical protein
MTVFPFHLGDLNFPTRRPHRRGDGAGDPRRQDRLLPRRRAFPNCARRWPMTSARPRNDDRPRRGGRDHRRQARDHEIPPSRDEPRRGRALPESRLPDLRIPDRIPGRHGPALPLRIRPPTASPSTSTTCGPRSTENTTAIIYNDLQNPISAESTPASVRRSPQSRRSSTCGCSPTRRTSRCATKGSPSRSPRCRACASAPSSSTRSRRSTR